jgi:hypothetical protein
MRLLEVTIGPKVHTRGSTFGTGFRVGKTVEENVMNTLHNVRKFALVAVLATGALIASASQADEIAQLGSLVVTAPRVTDSDAPMLGVMTVTARRPADARVADLGSITVTASRTASLAVATAPSSVHSWQ